MSNKQGQLNKNNTLRHTHEIAVWGLVPSYTLSRTQKALLIDKSNVNFNF